MEIVAITGSIGCGKTTIADLVRKLGFVVYDADKWCRYLYFNSDFLKEIEKVFPQTFEDGVFCKKKLRNIVFNDNRMLKKLENLTHPFLKNKFLNSISVNAKKLDIIFVDVALLFEMGWHKYCTYIIVADAPYEVQKQRVMQRDGISGEDFEKIVNVQIDNEIKKKLSDFVVDTNKPLGKLKVDLIKLIDGLLQC